MQTEAKDSYLLPQNFFLFLCKKHAGSVTTFDAEALINNTEYTQEMYTVLL
jgi:hypothetical protein